MRKVLGAILGAAGGAAIAVGITSVLISPFDADTVSQTPMLVGGGIVAIVISPWLYRLSMVVAPVVGVVTALALLAVQDPDLLTGNVGWVAFTVACVLLGPAILAAIILTQRRKHKRAAALVQTGNKAVASIVGVRQTGLLINHQPQILIDFMIHPLDGSAPFPHQKRRVHSLSEVAPRPGLAWPAWYSPADPSTVAVGGPSLTAPWDAQAESLARGFGLTAIQMFGYDPRTGHVGATAPSLAPGFGP